MTMLLQLAQQRSIPEILLEIGGIGFIHDIDLRNRTSALPEMPAEMNKGPVLPYIVVIGGDIRAVFRPKTEIHAVAARLGDLFYPGDRGRTIRGKKLPDVVNYRLHRSLWGVKISIFNYSTPHSPDCLRVCSRLPPLSYADGLPFPGYCQTGR